MAARSEKVVVLGASPKADRYSNMALHRLLEAGHQVIPVHPVTKVIEGITVSPSLSDVRKKFGPGIDTVTMYVNPVMSNAVADELVALRPKRVIFNPGSENPSLMSRLKSEGIEVLEACTLVLLRTQQF